MKRLDALHWALLVLLAVVVAYSVLTPYRYHKLGIVLVRVNRLTGSPEKLTGLGWQEMKSRD